METIDARKYTVIHRNGERNALGQFIKGGKLSNAARKAISKKRIGMNLSAEHCRKIAKAKMGDKNPAYGKTGFESWRGRHVICLDTGEVFGSIYDAARKMNVSIKSIRWNADGKVENPRKYHWAWVEDKEQSK